MTDRPSAAGVTLLGVFAHPDDEQGLSGVFTRAVEQGAKAYILCATRGQAGQISDPSFATPENLGEVREQELRNALSILGWEPPIFLDYYDGKLNQLPDGELADAVLKVIRELKPQVVVTFESTGGYGHVDHIAIHHATNAAIARSGDASYRPDLGPAYDVPKFYYFAFPRSAMQKFIESMGDEADIGGDQRTISFEEMGTPDEIITTVSDMRDYRALAYRALSAHRTQFSAEALESFGNESPRDEFFGITHLLRVKPAPTPGAQLPDETDILEGIV
jgi:LmbE family N-acetylglucosaminyl deacetylase